MGTEKNSSKETRRRAKDLSKGEAFEFMIFPIAFRFIKYLSKANPMS